MKKVGIITLFGYNYGNKLQNYAVQKIVENTGNEAVTIIDSTVNGIPKSTTNKEFLGKLSPQYVAKVINSRFKTKYPYKNDSDGIIASVKFAKKNDINLLYAKRKESFDDFTDKHLKVAQLSISSQDYEKKELDKYDYFICGSDQIWNPTYKDTGLVKFLQFAPEHKRIAFSPSFGLSKLPENVENLYRGWLESIPNLSVRERKGAEIIKNLCGLDVPVLPDPTLCLTKEEWLEVEEKPDFDTSEKYVLTYFLGNETNQYRKFIEKYAKSNRLKIIDLFDLRKSEYYSANPAHFVYLIHNAQCVFTDSFHGTVFSIIMHTPFVIFDRVENGGQGMSSRIDTLLDTFSMSKRKYKSVNKNNIDKVDFSEVDEKICELRSKTYNYLKKAFDTTQTSDSNIEKEFVYFLDKKSDCCGCYSCVNACPQGCINMKTDFEGFWYPHIDSSKCVNCGLCEKACPAVASLTNDNKPYAFVGYNKDKTVRKNSSSGGIFTAVSNYVIDCGGVVFGAAFDDKFNVNHMCIDQKENLCKLRSSKYVQSKIGQVYSQVKDFLKSDILVFFTGTPCQIEGLFKFLGKDYDNLLTQDIICHGVPSPMVWSRYIELMANGNKIKNVSFRNKKYGWHYFSMHIETDKKSYTKRLDEDPYMNLFLNNTILRPSCYDCKFKKEIRISDFTLADCWKSSSVKTSLKDDDKGLSMFFVNTKKGKNILLNLKENLEYEQIDYELAVSSQGAAITSVRPNARRNQFFNYFNSYRGEDLFVQWNADTPISKMKKKLVFIKTKLKNLSDR